MTILDSIVEARKHRLVDAKKKVPEQDLLRTISKPVPFFNATPEITVIAECKKGSPSAGILVDNYDPGEIAADYQLGGAHALSVLTEPDFFYGSNNHILQVKKRVSLPVLRKDFIIDSYQVKEAWAIGADAILLIVAVLSDGLMQELAAYARELQMQVLVEVHDAHELERSLKIPAQGIGINARNLKDFSIDRQASKDLCKHIPPTTVAVAESGIRSIASGKEMLDAGFTGFLVGEYFVTAPNRVDCVRDFVDALSGKK